jgi:hypothetical protein
MAWDLTVSCSNKPGELAKASLALGKQGVNIEGVAAFGSGDSGEMHFLVDDPEQARGVLQDAGFTITSSNEVLIATVENEPGVLASFAGALAVAGANVSAMYLGVDNQLVAVVPDASAVQSAWEEAATAGP